MRMPEQNGCTGWDSGCEIRGVPASGPGGFSLIEMLITLALMIILSTMLWGFGSASHQRAQKKACEGNLSKIYLALEIYASDCGGKFPATTNARTAEEALDVLVPRYSADTGIFICPGGRDSSLPAGESFRKRRISYAYYMGWQLTNTAGTLMSDRQVDTMAKNEGDFVFSTTGKPPGNNHHKYGGNFLFCDGRIESTPPQLSFPILVTPGIVFLNPKP